MPNWELVPTTQNRALEYQITNTLTDQVQTFSILTPADCGFGPQWSWDPWSGAMSIPSAYRAATLISGLIGAMPLHGYRSRPGEPALKLEPTPQLLADPSPPSTRVDVMSSWVLDYLWHGNAIGVFAEWDLDTGWPTSVIPVPADQVSTRRNSLGIQVYGIGDREFGPAQIFHVRGPHRPGALRGIGLLESALGTFDLAREQQRQAQGLASHGVPTGVLTSSNPDETVERLREGKAAWLESQRTRTIAALAPGMSFQPISWNPEELQLAEARKMTDQQIAQLFGVPLRYLQMEIGGLTYSNPTLDAIDLLKFTIDQHLERFEQEWTRHLPEAEWAKYNRDAVLRGSTMERYQAYQLAIDAGFRTADEVRALEDLEPLPSIPAPSSEVQQALQLVTAAPSLVQDPGLPALVDQLRALNGKPPLSQAVEPVAQDAPEPPVTEGGDDGVS